MDYDRLRDLQQKFEENPRRYFAPLANEYRKGGQPRRAIEICRAQLAQMPSHMSGQIVYGQALYESGEFEEARQVFARALALDPENLIALRSLGDMSLQSGNTAEARSWYMRLLDADPKDTAAIALVSEIDSSAEAAPVSTSKEIAGVDQDVGDQAIPFIPDDAGVATVPERPSMESPPAPVDSTPAPAESAPAPPVTALPPERTMPARASEPAPAPEFEVPPPAEAEPTPAPQRATAEPDVVRPAAPRPPIAATHEAPAAPAEKPSAGPRPAAAPPLGLERHYPVQAASTSDSEEAFGAEGLQGTVEPAEPVGIEGLRGTEPEAPEPVGTEGLSGKPPVMPLAGATATRSDDEEALDNWTPPPPAPVHERVESRKEDRAFSGAAPEPFVNETMAQLYLQQGYNQLALRVYYQLAEARPNDQHLKDRIAEIEAADRAAHPEMAVEARKEAPPIETPAGPPAAPRSPSIETPTPGRAPESEEAPSFDRSPIDSPPLSQPSPERESIEAPARDEPRAEPEGIGARQPSVKEFFATLGRRRPPRALGSQAAGIRQDSSISAETKPAVGSVASSASLDAVFAGATVNPADSRAASRLAGAFSGVVGSSRTPPTPPMPTPRVNPRLPHMQESEEDVAKFRAWLDGLTGE